MDSKKSKQRRSREGGNAAWRGKDLPEGVLGGILTAGNIARMDMTGTELVVLSACQTGLGAEGADGIFGLQRGFKNAGVHTLLMSLDFANDESTTKLMIAFYEGIANGLSKREALLEAQKKLRQEDKYRVGKYWAPFILLDALE